MIMEAFIAAMVKAVSPLATFSFVALLAKGPAIAILFWIPPLAGIVFFAVLTRRRDTERARVEGDN